MHSVDSSVSPKKRTLSRGLSEEESLRSFMKETEASSRRLARSDSRAGTLKKMSDSQLSDQDLLMGLPEMLELQASYDEVVQELRGLEVERETLLFQVDVLQDTLEGVEELLAEAQREAGQASAELEHERVAKRKLESMVGSLMKEVESLKEEKNEAPAPANAHGREDEAAAQGHQRKADGEEQIRAVRGEEPRSACERRVVNKPVGHIPSLALDNPPSEDGVLWRPYEDGVDAGRDPSPDRNDSDHTSAYEDASAETPEQDRIFPGDGDTSELPYDSDNKEKSPSHNSEVNNGETQDLRNPDMCTVS